MAIDVQNKEFKVGQKVARAAKMYATDGLYVTVAEVTKVDGDKVYLDNSKQPMKFPDRIAIIGG